MHPIFTFLNFDEDGTDTTLTLAFVAEAHCNYP
jgi:hypothetical protein